MAIAATGDCSTATTTGGGAAARNGESGRQDMDRDELSKGGEMSHGCDRLSRQ